MPGFNKLITRGMGSSRGAIGRAGLVTQGYGGVFRFVLEAMRRGLRIGRSGRRQEERTATVYAKLINVNGEPPERKIAGSITIELKQGNVAAAVRLIGKSAGSILEQIKVSVTRLIKG